MKSAAQDDLIALSDGVTGHHADVSIQRNQEAAEEQGAALSAYERGTAALDAAKRVREMGKAPHATFTDNHSSGGGYGGGDLGGGDFGGGDFGGGDF